ncbi:hypothetical protein [Mycolicibacterium nivoides]|uniref:Uncharacterized protein n=1 Tax=Mycolicibacterium nivoides TaxID=2487344 RepID=A0ABW9LN12_9MYCO
MEATPAADAPPVVTAAPRELGCDALDRALKAAPPALGDVIAREKLYSHTWQRNEIQARRAADRYDGAAPMPTGPVQAILLDPLLTTLTGDQRVARVQQILHETKPVPRWRQAATALLVLACVAGLTALIVFRPPLLWGLLITTGIMGTMMIVSPRRHGRLTVPARYPTISLDDALQLAALTPKLWQTPPAPFGTVWTAPRSTDRNPESPSDSRAQLPLFGKNSAQREVAPSASASEADRRRIAEVHAAVAELDAEWLDYQLDLHAWFLAKPQLRNLNDPIIKAYRQAEAELRDRADELTENSTEQQIADAQDAARHALKAWNTANRHAMKIGVSTLSPTEDAALHRLHGLVSQLNDRTTPKAMWPQLINAISRTMTKLTTVPCTLADIAKLPVIESESRLRAIE